MKGTIKAYGFLEILGIALSTIGIIAGVIAVFPNWESHHKFDMKFIVNDSEEISSYYAVAADSLQIFQQEGNSDCRYSVYYQTRGATSYKTVVTKLTFDENNTWDGESYSLKSSWWNDVRFKVNKTAGQSVCSLITLSLGESTD